MKGQCKKALLLLFLPTCILYIRVMYFSKQNPTYRPKMDNRDKDVPLAGYGNKPVSSLGLPEFKEEFLRGLIGKTQTVEYKNRISSTRITTKYINISNFIENVRIDKSQHQTNSLNVVDRNYGEYNKRSLSLLVNRGEKEAKRKTINEYLYEGLQYKPAIMDVNLESVSDGLVNVSAGLVHSDDLVESWNKRNFSKTIETLAGVLLDVIPRSFEKKYKNPCWYDDKQLRCLPYFYLAGTPKSGTTDVWQKIVQHQDIVSMCLKEPHWWTRVRFLGDMETQLEKYIARQRPLVKLLTSREAQYRTAIMGDGSASTFWDFKIWNELFPNESEVPRETHASLIHTIQPDAKIIVIFRNPTDRFYSDYYYFNRDQILSPMMFHRCSIEAITIFNNCLQKHNLRTCVYSKRNFYVEEKDEEMLSKCPNMRLIVGLYDVFTQDWLNVFPRDQLFFMTTQDWNSHCVEYLKRIYIFLGLDIQSDDDRRKECQNEQANTGKKKPPMLDESRKLLDDFYRPHMRRLSNLLNHTKYSWNL